MIFQFAFAGFIFRTQSGKDVFSGVNSAVIAVIDAALAGPKFVFGSLADSGRCDELGLGFILFFQGLTTILVVSALITLLYHVGLMSRLLRLFAAVFSRLTKISGAESLAATANVFAGNESLLTIKPCLPRLTRSELCVLLATCMATVSANVIVPYVKILEGGFPGIAGHLVSASILSVPAAVLLAKLAVPETETPETLGVDVDPHFERENSVIEAVLGGAESGFKMIVGVTSMLIAMVGLLAIANLILGTCGVFLDAQGRVPVLWRIESLFGLLFVPFVWLMGVPWSDVTTVANLLGTRVIATEIPAYIELAGLMKNGTIEPRSGVMAAYALCGFAHIPSVAIYVGGATALAPNRKADIASLAWRALFIATLACLMTGAVAGLFYGGDAMIAPAIAD